MNKQLVPREIMPDLPCIFAEAMEAWPTMVSEVQQPQSTRYNKSKDLDVKLITPEFDKDSSVYRLRCPYAGVFKCEFTGLILEGEGEVSYWTIPWDKRFLDRNHKMAAGSMFKFKCHKGSFTKLYLPHCEQFPDRECDAISVAHITNEEVEFIQPKSVNSTHVLIDIRGFSAYGLMRPVFSTRPINGMVLLFHKPSDDPELYPSLYVLLLPKNALITQVANEWKKRIGATYIESVPDCELIPDHTYTLSGTPVELVQPETAKFLNYDNYENYSPSFEVRLEHNFKKVNLVLENSTSPWIWFLSSRWIGFFSSPVVWSRAIQLNATPPPDITAEQMEQTDILLHMLQQLGSQELKDFQRHLMQGADPIPKCELEKADQMETVNKMVQRYCLAGAKDNMTKILRKMNRNDLVAELQR